MIYAILDSDVEYWKSSWDISSAISVLPQRDGRKDVGRSTHYINLGKRTTDDIFDLLDKPRIPDGYLPCWDIAIFEKDHIASARCPLLRGDGTSSPGHVHFDQNLL